MAELGFEPGHSGITGNVVADYQRGTDWGILRTGHLESSGFLLE